MFFLQYAKENLQLSILVVLCFVLVIFAIVWCKHKIQVSMNKTCHRQKRGSYRIEGLMLS